MKKSFVLLTVFLLAPLAFALPGVKPFLPDVSGQYVYYKDTTFERESYTGFLYYDEGTYAIRYYAPQVKDKKKPLPEKDVQILFTLDASKNYVDLTGERIITRVTPEDTDIINYIHDILYELTSRRQKIPYFTDKTASRQDYEQFGGKVTLIFDALIPLFNLKSITTADNKVVFSLVTAGQLASSEDNSFFAFKGIPPAPVDKRHSFKQKKAEKASYLYHVDDSTYQKIFLDTQWQQSMDNLWLLGDNAILVVDIIPRPQTADDSFVPLLTRRMLLGTEYSYPDLSQVSIAKSGEKIEITKLQYQPTSESVTQDFKILTKLKNGSVAFFTLTVFNGAYTKNKAYFKQIIDSYEIEQNPF